MPGRRSRTKPGKKLAINEQGVAERRMLRENRRTSERMCGLGGFAKNKTNSFDTGRGWDWFSTPDE